MSAAEKDGERGGRFPTVRYEHLLGLIGRSHFPAQSQAEEREERRRLDWDRGNTIFTSSAKRKAESPRAAGVCTDGEDNHKILCLYSHLICVYS